MTQNNVFEPVLETRTEYHENPVQNQDGVVPEGGDHHNLQDGADASGDADNPELQKWMSKDLETVAKAKVNSDQFIRQLQSELSGLRQELSTSLTLQEFLEKQQQATNTQTSTAQGEGNTRTSQFDAEGAEGMVPTKNDSPGDNNTNANLADEVNKILEQQLSSREQAARETDNLRRVKDEATKVLGEEYPLLFSKKAKELNLDTAYMNEMAKTQPEAFLAIMLGQDYKATSSGAPPLGSTTSEGRASVNPTRKKGTNIADWDDIKKEDARKYWSAPVQNEIHKAGLEAQKQGIEDFWVRK